MGDNLLLHLKNIASLDVTNTTIQLRKQYSDITVVNRIYIPDWYNYSSNHLMKKDILYLWWWISWTLKESQVEIGAIENSYIVALSVQGKALFATVLKSKVVTKQKN